MAEQTVRQQIQELREFFNTVARGTPLVKEAIGTMNTAINAWLGQGGRVDIYASQLASAFNLIKTSSTATDVEINKVTASLEKLMATSNAPGSKLRVLGGSYASYPSGRISGAGAKELVRDRGLSSYNVSQSVSEQLRKLTRNLLPNASVGDLTPSETSFNKLINDVRSSSQINYSDITKQMGPSGILSSSFIDQQKAVTKVIPALELLAKKYKNVGVSSAEAAKEQQLLSAQLANLKHIASQPGGFEKLQSSLRSIRLLQAGASDKMSMTDYFDKTFGAGGQAIHNKVEAFAKRYGYTMKQITGITREASTGIARISFKRETPVIGNDNIKMIDKLSLSIDKAGSVAKDNQGRFRSFASGVMRDTGEFLKWSIAASAVYVPLQQLSKMMEEMTENQSKLADLQIITNQSSDEVYTSFSKIADVASLTGQNIGDTIDAYKAAYVAAGGLSNENERAATATVLLSDSLLLTRLSTLTQAESLDILASALKQVGGQLGDTDNKLLAGVDLLDKWVAVSKVANVSVDTLARSFSIVGSAAEDVGLGIDELNGVIAAVAEVSSLSPTETGNMVRAFISGYQSDEAIKELGKFGIAVTDTEGKVREYMTVMEEVKSLTDAGIISPEQAAKIADTLGGGARRGAQYASFLDNLNKVQQIASVSATAQSLAYEALGIKMDTLKGSSQKLGVSFSTLAQSLGTQGGILDSASSLLDILTSITGKITNLSNALGTALPMLLTFGTAMAFFSLNTAAADKGIALLSRVGYALGSGAARKLGVGAKDLTPALASDKYTATPAVREEMMITGMPPIITGTPKAGDAWGSKFSQTLVTNLPKIIAAAVIAGPAIANAREGQWGGAAGDVAGGLGGFMLGTKFLGKFGMMAGPIGAMIGVAIAESFVNAVTKDVSLAKGLADAYTKALTDSLPKTTEEEKATAVEKLERDYENKFRGSTILSNMIAPWFQKGGWAAGATGQEMTPEQAQLAVTQFFVQIFGGDAGKRANEKLIAGMTKFIDETVQSDQDAQNKISTKMSEQVTAAGARFGQLDAGIVSKGKAEATQKVQFGEISGTEFKTQLTTLQTLPILTKQLWAVAGEEFQKNAKGIENADEAYTELSNTILGLTDQERSLFIQMAGEIAVLQGNNEKVDERIAKEKELGMLLASARSGQAIQQIQIPQIADFGKTGYQSAVNTLMKAQKETKEYYAQFIDDPVALEKFLSDLDQVSARYWKEAGESGAFAYTSAFDGIDQEILSKVMDAARKAGEISIKPQDINIQNMSDMTQGEFNSNLFPNYQAWDKFIDTAFGEQPEEQTGIIFKDGFLTLSLNMLAMQLAQQKTNELLQEQIDGIYNLPEGMQLWVPSQAAEMSAKTLAGGGGGGGGYIGPPALNGENLTQPAISATVPQAVIDKAVEAALAMAETKMLRAEEPRLPEREELTGMDFWRELLGLKEYTTAPRVRDDEESPLINNLYKATTPGMAAESPTIWSPLTNALSTTFNTFTGSLETIFSSFKLPDTSANTKPVVKSDFTVNTTNNFNVDGMRLATYVKRLIARDLAGYGGSRTISGFMS